MYLFCGYMPIEKFELFDAKMVENGSDLMEPSNLIIYREAKQYKVTNCASGTEFDDAGWPYSELKFTGKNWDAVSVQVNTMLLKKSGPVGGVEHAKHVVFRFTTNEKRYYTLSWAFCDRSGPQIPQETYHSQLAPYLLKCSRVREHGTAKPSFVRMRGSFWTIGGWTSAYFDAIPTPKARRARKEVDESNIIASPRARAQTKRARGISDVGLTGKRPKHKMTVRSDPRYARNENYTILPATASLPRSELRVAGILALPAAIQANPDEDDQSESARDSNTVMRLQSQPFWRFLSPISHYAFHHIGEEFRDRRGAMRTQRLYISSPHNMLFFLVDPLDTPRDTGMSMTKYDHAGIFDLQLQLETAEGRSNQAQILIIKHPFATNDSEVDLSITASPTGGVKTVDFELSDTALLRNSFINWIGRK
ncbi:hypothetical protein C8J57DRAFT_1220226 [Mycena rebaudengoi]|nr:hypothetical protein C8J57DRAFT_1220226 [Mycena rebaudengoi]